MFFRRGVAEDDRWLQAKMWIFSIGALLALVGMALENDWVIGAAGVVLLAGVLLRFVGGSAADGTEGPGTEDGDAGTGDDPAGREGID